MWKSRGTEHICWETRCCAANVQKCVPLLCGLWLRRFCTRCGKTGSWCGILISWGEIFFVGIFFGNGTCTLRGYAGKSSVVGRTLRVGRWHGNGSGTKVGFTLISVGGWNTGIGCTVSGRNCGRGRMGKQGCFTLSLNKYAIWWTALFFASQYDRKRRVLRGSLIIARISLIDCLRWYYVVVDRNLKVFVKNCRVSADRSVSVAIM